LDNSELLKNFFEYKEKIPCYYLIDKKMNIRSFSNEPIDVQRLTETLKEIMNEQ